MEEEEEEEMSSYLKRRDIKSGEGKVLEDEKLDLF